MIKLILILIFLLILNSCGAQTSGLNSSYAHSNSQKAGIHPGQESLPLIGNEILELIKTDKQTEKRPITLIKVKFNKQPENPVLVADGTKNGEYVLNLHQVRNYVDGNGNFGVNGLAFDIQNPRTNSFIEITRRVSSRDLQGDIIGEGSSEKPFQLNYGRFGTSVTDSKKNTVLRTLDWRSVKDGRIVEKFLEVTVRNNETFTLKVKIPFVTSGVDSRGLSNYQFDGRFEELELVEAQLKPAK